MSARVNPDRARRYRKRTMTKPPTTFVMSLRDQEERERWVRAWERGTEEGMTTPAVVEWHGRVRAYCAAKGLGRPEITVWENSDLSTTLRWEQR